jgi:hypothetical protein
MGACILGLFGRVSAPKNIFGSDSSSWAAFLMELKPFWKTLKWLHLLDWGRRMSKLPSSIFFIFFLLIAPFLLIIFLSLFLSSSFLYFLSPSPPPLISLRLLYSLQAAAVGDLNPTSPTSGTLPPTRSSSAPDPDALSLLTDKRRIPLRSASVRTPHLFHHGIPNVLVNPRSKGITSVRSTTTH